ncbi:ribosomal RNA small subunit methyltransferase nep-1 isoform X2 [Triticum aestivum]|uniref:ribosomal RNA small subunit methyltransferase nep-1 isoform X2 n=1 Tax=Triticum aestivum TaxID=4565 RepID=UPI001D007D24|nr:ribosomal RNA small subunit methyltransferase nep-1-like isoform X2 [Triticum aestivum]
MGRRYSAKGKKKRKLEDGATSRDDDAAELPPPEDDEGKGEEDATERDETVEVAEGIPVLPRPVDGRKRPRAIFVLERACLEVGKVGKTMQILNSDDHANYLRKHNRNPADYRPDIIYQALLAIFDSPLTKAGRLQAVYVRTEKGVLFEVKPNVRLPRTCKRFCGLMSELLQKLSITAVGRREKLLNVIKNPVSQYLPVGSRKIGLSYSADKSVNLNDYVAESSDDEALVFVVGAMAHGKIDNEYTDEYIRISSYPLSAAWCLGKICTALEQKWDIQ